MDTDTIDPAFPSVISRDEARQNSLKKYFTGVSCKNGHMSERYVSNKNCCECTSINNDKNKSNPSRIKKQKEWVAKNRGRIREQRRAWRQTVEGREKTRLLTKSTRERYPDEVKARVRSWRLRNKDRINEYERRRYAEKKSYQHTEAGKKAMLARTRNRRALKKEVGGTHTVSDIQDIYRLQMGKCAICRKKLDESYHVDHIMPIARGGSNARSNLQLTHGSCNQKKHEKDPIDHMQSLGFLL